MPEKILNVYSENWSENLLRFQGELKTILMWL